MKILTIAEHYPSPFKPYHDAQFERFVLDGHELEIGAFGYHEGDLNAVVRRHDFHRKTRYLPVTLKDLRSTALSACASLLANPASYPSRLASVIKGQGSWKRKLLDGVRAMRLPKEPPELCIVHNLRALMHSRVLRSIYPDAVIGFYFHGNELPGVPTPDPLEVRNAFAFVDVVFTNTENSKSHVVARGCPAEKVVVSPVGFDLDEFPDPIGRTYLSGGKLNVLMAGRVAEGKGTMLGVRAFQEITQSHGIAATLRIVGDGTEFAQLKTYVAQNGLESSVELLGRRTQERLLDEYRRADVFMLPSHKAGNWEENQACVVQEAMLMRSVVLVSRTGGVPEATAPEMLEFSFQPGDVSGLIDALRRVAALGESELRDLGARGRTYVEQRFDIRQLNAHIIETAMQRGRVGT